MGVFLLFEGCASMYDAPQRRSRASLSPRQQQWVGVLAGFALFLVVYLIFPSLLGMSTPGGETSLGGASNIRKETQARTYLDQLKQRNGVLQRRMREQTEKNERLDLALIDLETEFESLRATCDPVIQDLNACITEYSAVERTVYWLYDEYSDAEVPLPDQVSLRPPRFH